jgi:hypothetical protein
MIEDHAMALKLNQMSQELSEIKTDMKQLVAAMTRLALAEERIGQVNSALERSFRRIDALEQASVQQRIDGSSATRATVWVDRGIVAAVGAAAMFIAKKTGLL